MECVDLTTELLSNIITNQGLPKEIQFKIFAVLYVRRNGKTEEQISKKTVVPEAFAYFEDMLNSKIPSLPVTNRLLNLLRSISERLPEEGEDDSLLRIGRKAEKLLRIDWNRVRLSRSKNREVNLDALSELLRFHIHYSQNRVKVLNRYIQQHIVALMAEDEDALLEMPTLNKETFPRYLQVY